MNPDWKDKKVLVMGLGLHGGGAGTAEFLVKQGAKVTVTDLRSRQELAPSLRGLRRYKNIRYVLGRHRREDFHSADLIVKNPGVRRDAPLLREAARRRIPIASDIGIFFQLCPARIIGVTGTRGKSTTTYLIWKFLKTKFRRAHYGGNIRRSVLTLVPRIRKSDLVVLELSSFQLADLAREKKSPHIAVITNIFRDHLNWHRSMPEYIEAKSAIFRSQKKGDFLFINSRDRTLARLVRGAPARARRAALPRQLEKIVDRNLGPHYRPVAALAAAVARHFGVAAASIAETLKTFRGLEGRQQEIAIIRGIHFINDTTATIPEAAVAAVRRFREKAAKHRLFLITGGSDKKLDFTRMAAAIRKYVDCVALLPGDASLKLAAALASIENAKSMGEAVRRTYRLAEKGDYIVLSPGAASFGLFLNEFDRGKQFADEVRKLMR